MSRPTPSAWWGGAWGGYLEPRGVSAEPRIRALVADPGHYEFTSRFVDMFSPEDWQRVLAGDAEMDARLDGFLADQRSRELYGSRMAAMGAATFGEWLRIPTTYSLDGLAEALRGTHLREGVPHVLCRRGRRRPL